MLKNFIKIALRTLWRNKFHAAINILGLAIGISACLVIYLTVSNELDFNTDIKDRDRIYRIHSQFTGTFSGLNRGAPTAVAQYVRENFSGVQNVSLFFCFGSDAQIPTGSDRKKFDDQIVAIADTAYFSVFKCYDWLVGSPDVLTRPHQVVLTESQARKYFGEGDLSTMIGEEIIYRDSLSTQVSGIIRDLSIRTDLAFTDFISTATIESSWLRGQYELNNWTSTSSSTQVFVKTAPGTQQHQLTAQLPKLARMSAETTNDTWSNSYNVQPLDDLHFNASTGIFDFSPEPAHLPTLLTLIGVAALLLIIGAINFINLETAQAVRRAKEVGIRKVLGSSRVRLITQFLCEGLVLTSIAIILAMPLTEFGLSYFSEFIPAGTRMNAADVIPFLIFIAIFIGILASTYPAFILSSFLPALALKNQAHVGGHSRAGFLRKALIVFQFTFAQALIIGTIMVAWQVRFLLNKDLGFRKDAVVYFSTPKAEDSNKAMVLKNVLESISGIDMVSLSEAPPAYNGWSSSVVSYHGKEDKTINAYRKFGDDQYMSLYEIRLLSGRNLLASDTARELLVNATMMKVLGFSNPDDVLGETINYGGHELPIVGVVEDFNTSSLRNKVEPLIMACDRRDFRFINLRIAAQHESGAALREILDKVENAYKQVYSDASFEYQFLDETIRNFYRTERRASKLAGTATGLAIFISCLGLFGLASHTAVQRTKEIGIRKVMGATAQQIVLLLSGEFIMLVLIAFLLAAPTAWITVSQWLQGFSYHEELSVWMFVVTVCVAVVVAFITVSYQTFAAAAKNPVDSLKNE